MSDPVFPVFLRLAGRQVLVVGGGAVAASKLSGLRKANARVTVVAPEIRPEIEEAGVRLLRRRFRPKDLAGAWLVVAAATPEVNRRVASAAEARQVFVNAVDDPRSATAYLGGVFDRAGVTVSISTGGEAPALAGLLREGLEALVPEDVGDWLEQARTLRREWRANRTPMAGRRPLLLKALNRLYAERGSAPVVGVQPGLRP
ncbi:MAG TPA: bifunctional precorrin-2 dehydrogenase/sirohydrochlorin ferrochelatase [Vicinamibacteria bacterium]|nr:bifunctional precorrin-2 dehydrogenase/sirohydrochlorin ferrochelatase [Vicinamibacteria bacterium]